MGSADGVGDGDAVSMGVGVGGGVTIGEDEDVESGCDIGMGVAMETSGGKSADAVDSNGAELEAANGVKKVCCWSG